MSIWYLGIDFTTLASEFRVLPHTENSRNEYEFVQNLENSKKRKENEENAKIKLKLNEN